MEAQTDFYPGYPLIKRGIYYCCRMISSQYGREFTGPHYEKLKKAYSIWVCMNPPGCRKNSIIRYRLEEKPLVGESAEGAGTRTPKIHGLAGPAIDKAAAALDSETAFPITDSLLSLDGFTGMIATRRPEKALLERYDEIFVLKTGVSRNTANFGI